VHVWSKLAGFGRFALRIRALVDDPLTLDEATRQIRAGVDARSDRFLAMLARTVAGNPRSPYRALMAAAGCEIGDIAGLVAREGLEGALTALARTGVYVAYDEFKGRAPAVRGSQRLHFRPDDFDDPILTRSVSATSAGTRGAPTRVPLDAAIIGELAPAWMVFLAEHRCLDAPLIFWTPAHAGVAARYLSCARFGQRYAHWFVSEDVRSVKGRLHAATIHRLARRAGRFPRPQKATFDDPGPLLDCLLNELADRKRPCVNTAPSAAVNLTLAAGRRGVSLSGVTFLLGSEPLTSARRTTIERSGARAVPLYGSTEAPWIGGQCRHATMADEVHVLADAYAVVPGDQAMVEHAAVGQTLLVTSLRHALPKVLVNVDIGDRAVIERRACDCTYGRLGCDVRLHTIRSSDKITEFGVTFALQDVFHVLEDALPGRFGGSAGDYQLVEDRNEQGLARYTILVNPALDNIDEAIVPHAFLSEIGRLRDYYGAMASTWSRERLIRVRRASPVAGPSGKVLPFHRVDETSPPASDRPR
jgi:hypothetical protein